jgi:Tfp pilus assembly protein PilZ
MTRAAFVLTAALVLVVRPAAEAQHGEWAVFTPANDVSFIIVPTQSSYHVGETIRLKYDVVNVSNRALYVSKVVCPPPVMAWLEDSAGHHITQAGVTSCLGPAPGTSMSDRMQMEAQLLEPGDRLSNTTTLDTKALTPGDYRVEAVFYGWKPEQFSDAEVAELAKMGAPFLRGEVPASAKVTLTR